MKQWAGIIVEMFTESGPLRECTMKHIILFMLLEGSQARRIIVACSKTLSILFSATPCQVVFFASLRLDHAIVYEVQTVQKAG